MHSILVHDIPFKEFYFICKMILPLEFRYKGILPTGHSLANLF